LLRSNYKANAFSLIELIFAIALIAIIGVSAVSRFLRSDQFKQTLFVKQVISSLSYIQNLAISSGCHISVNASYSSISFNLRQNCTTGIFNQSVFDPKNMNNLFVLNAPSNIAIAFTNFPVYFDTDGLARRVSNSSIVDAMLNINGNVIVITGNTGFIGQ
jgi:prepilin-type N-terminal cleavage/methylation domain-containing protein